MRQSHLFGAVAILTLLTAGIGYRVRASPITLETIFVAIYALYHLSAEYLKDQIQSRPERIRAFITGDIYFNPLVISFFVVCALQFVERASGFILGAAIGRALGSVGQEQLLVPVIKQTSPTFVIWITAIMIIPIAKYAAHRIRKFQFGWITGAIAVDTFVTWAVGQIFFFKEPMRSWPSALLYQAAAASYLLPGAVIGYLWAKKTQVAYSVSGLFRHLPRSDQEAIIDLLQQQPQRQ